MFSISPPGSYSQFRKDPGMAMMLSFVLPGLGQIYSGEKRKGSLFIGVSIVNFLLFATLIGSAYLLNLLVDFGKAFHLTPNRSLFGLLSHLSLSSPPVLLTVMFFLLFVAYAAKDAYQSALWRKQPIYPGHALTMPEATSSSYLAHCALLTDCFLFALFFLVPQRPPTQNTIIEFVNNPATKQQHVQTQTQLKSINASTASGPHVENSPRKPTADATKQKPSAAPTPSHAVAYQPTQQNTHATESPPQKTAFVPRPIAKLINPTTTTPLPMPRLTSQPNAPRPLPRAIEPATNPSPSAPHPNPIRPQALPSLMAFVPRSATGGASSTTPSPLPFKAPGINNPGPGPLPTRPDSGGGNPQPRFNPGGGPAGGPSSPGPVPVNMNRGNDHHGGGGAPVPIIGDRGGHPGESSSGPTPGRVGPTNGNGNSPLALLPRLGSSPLAGLHDGKSQSGEPGVANTDSNPHPKGPISNPSERPPFDIGAYMADLQRRIKRAWLPPHQPDSRQVVVVFKIHRNGEMSNLRLSQSSGNAASDQAAMAAVERAAPFRPLPDACPEDEVDIQFTFDYKVFSGSGIYRRF